MKRLLSASALALCSISTLTHAQTEAQRRTVQQVRVAPNAAAQAKWLDENPNAKTSYGKASELEKTYIVDATAKLDAVLARLLANMRTEKNPQQKQALFDQIDEVHKRIAYLTQRLNAK